MSDNVWGVPPPLGLEDQQYVVLMQMAEGNWPMVPLSVDWHYSKNGNGTIVWRTSADHRHYVYGLLSDATSQIMEKMHRHRADWWKAPLSQRMVLACKDLIEEDIALDQLDGNRRRMMSQELCANMHYAIEEQACKWNAQQLAANSLSESSRR